MPANENLMSLTADIVSAYVTRNAVPAGDLPALIGQVHSSISSLAAGKPAVEEIPTPAVSIKKSITPDYLISLEDGKKFKSLKRHLRTHYDLSPEELKKVPSMPASLEEALLALEEDYQFLLKGDVFSEELIETFIHYKRKNEADAIRLRPHPYEFALYYDI